jgi:CubicO group peptidase (beta-lactamase class C family)
MADGVFQQDSLAQIPAMLQSVVDAGDLSGFVTLIWRKGEIVQLNTLGLRNVEDRLPMQRDTLFRIASMTKPITTVAALQQIEEGKLKLDDPIAKWMPEFSSMRVLKDAAGPLDQTEPAARAITVEDLMTHRSGLAYDFSSQGPIAKAHTEALGSPIVNALSPDEWLKRLATLPLSYQPGTRMHYSLSTDVLGFLVGRVDGKPFRQSLIDRIFTPLGMNDTDFWIPPEKRQRAAFLYKVDAKLNTLVRAPWATFDRDAPPEFCGGGGGLISTADDYLKFARMLLNNGEVDGVRVLKALTVAWMRTNRLSEEQRQHPFLGMPFWLAMGFGLGVSIVLDPEKHQWMGAASEGSFGWPGAFGTWWQADPVEDLILIYMIQNEADLSPEGIAALATGQRMGGRMALPNFQRAVYGALGQ